MYLNNTNVKIGQINITGEGQLSFSAIIVKILNIIDVKVKRGKCRLA